MIDVFRNFHKFFITGTKPGQSYSVLVRWANYENDFLLQRKKMLSVEKVLQFLGNIKVIACP